MGKVLQVVNNDYTTSIPLEIAGFLENNLNCDISTVIYFSESKYPENNFVKNPVRIRARNLLDINAIIKSAKLIRALKPIVIHTHDTRLALVFFLLAKILAPSAKLIKTVHSKHNFSGWKISIWPKLVSNFLIFLMSDFVIGNSQSTLNTFSSIEKKITTDKRKVVYNGINLDSIRNANLNNDEKEKLLPGVSNELLIASVGRFIQEKDYQSLIRGFAILRSKLEEDIKLILIGDGPQKSELLHLISELGLEEHVIFTGAIKRHFVYGLLNEISVFVMPSKSEGFCNALVEAMAAQKPVVCSDIDTLREVAGDAALYGKVGQPEEFARQMLKLLEDEKLMQEMKEKATKRAENFSLEACAGRYLKYYSQLEG